MYSKGTKVKVSLRRKYAYDMVEVVAEEQSYNPESVIEMPIKEVLEILEVQTRYEELQQKVKPIWEEAQKVEQTRREQEQAEKERLAAQVEAEV